MKQTFTGRNCNVPCCNGQHLIEFINGKAIIPTKECLEIIRDWEENVKIICDGIIWSKDKMCNAHKKMANLYFLSEFIRYNNTVRNYRELVVFQDFCKKIFYRRRSLFMEITVSLKYIIFLSVTCENFLFN